jgi:hypothetical protein
MTHSGPSGEQTPRKLIEPWNFSAVSDAAFVSPNLMPTFKKNSVAGGLTTLDSLSPIDVGLT